MHGSLGVELAEEPALVKAFVVDRNPHFGLISRTLVVDDLDGLELGVKETPLRRQDEPEVVAEHPEPDFPNFVVLVSAGIQTP